MSDAGTGPISEVSRSGIELDIDLVVAFLNTIDVEAGTDELTDSHRWEQWCVNRELRDAIDPDAELEAARQARDGMRASDAEDAPSVTFNWPMRVRFGAGAPALARDNALDAILASALRLTHTGHWRRVKICPAQDCLMAFYDRSRNRSRTWCAMRVCGNREKARSWRERHVTP